MIGATVAPYKRDRSFFLSLTVDMSSEKEGVSSDKECILDCLFKQFVFNAVIAIGTAADPQFLLKTNVSIYDIVQRIGKTIKLHFQSWFESMREKNLEDLENELQKLSGTDINKMRSENQSENLKLASDIIAHLISSSDLKKDILRSVGLDENIEMSVDEKGFVVVFDPESILPLLENMLESPQRKRKAPSPDIIIPKRAKTLPHVKGFIAFKYHPNPFFGVLSYTLVSFKEFIIDELCDTNWEEKLCRHLTEMNITNLFVQGAYQSRHLREKIPNVCIVTLPKRMKDKLCDECKKYSCSIGKVKNYMKDFHNFYLPISCKSISTN